MLRLRLQVVRRNAYCTDSPPVLNITSFTVLALNIASGFMVNC